MRFLIALLAVLSVSAAGKSYSVDGIVVALDPAAHSILVSHRPIGRYMPAMMMPFRVEDPADLNGLYPGARIQFELVVFKDHSAARHVRRVPGSDIEIPAPKEKLHIGDALPEFELTDQDGNTVRASDFRGKVLVIDFIYTRCPLPDVCPRLSANFAAIQRRFHDVLGRDLVLLSITVDPDYDTPAVLNAYARRWGADPRGWRFLTGKVAGIAGQFGEVYWADEGTIGHNSSTVIFSRAGRVAALVDGSVWRIEQLENLIARELGNPPARP